MHAPLNVWKWIESNRESFSPPIGNKLMYKNTLSLMFVGGPNRRTDYHIDESSEFFFQLQGNMELLIIERGERRLVSIRQGEVFLLPSRIPHSPQRPESGSMGFVLERARTIPDEYDCMRWYRDFNSCDDVEFEKFFHCTDLGKDLAPIAQAYAEFKKGGASIDGQKDGVTEDSVRPIEDNKESVVPDPFNIWGWIAKHADEFATGKSINLFGDDHPDNEFKIFLSSRIEEVIDAEKCEVMVWQLRGEADMKNGEIVYHLDDGACIVIPEGSSSTLNRDTTSSLTMIIHCDRLGNKT